jgi:NAD-dependent SIR2 family protein deacetylase
MFQIKGETRESYFHVDCAKCGKAVSLSNFRWVGGVPQVIARCDECKQEYDFKLWMPTWAAVAPKL